MEEKLATDASGSPDATTVVASTHIKPQWRKLHDPSISFEEYHYYAQKTRAEENTFESPKFNWHEIVRRSKPEHTAADDVQQLSKVNLSNPTNRLEISDEEWTNASRAFRTASWGACKLRFEIMFLQLYRTETNRLSLLKVSI